MKIRNILFIITGFTLILIACEKEEDYPPSLYKYPEAFTPNGDGLNDYWGPVGGLDPDSDTDQPGVNLDIYEMKIRNKNNRQLFLSEDINTPWDGTYKGDTCADSYYYYLVRYESLEGVKYRDEGVFELIR